MSGGVSGGGMRFCYVGIVFKLGFENVGPKSRA